MRLLGGLTRTVMACVAAVGLTTQFALADPVPAQPGKVHLPLTGLIIDLPAQSGTSYKLSGSWGLSEAGDSFDSRDVLDEFDAASGQLIAGNWAITGYFDNDCDSIIATEKLDGRWQTTSAVWGGNWIVGGGLYDISDTLSDVPTVLLCRTNEAGQSLLLYHFDVAKRIGVGQALQVQALNSIAVLKAMWTAYRTGSVKDGTPLRRPEVRMRGSTAASRAVTLPNSGLRLQLPNDGRVWLAHDGDQSDIIDLMAPTFPEFAFEVMPFPGQSCVDVFAAITDVDPKLTATGAPAGWLVGPGLIADGMKERLICRNASYGALMVGAMFSTDQSNVGVYSEVLDALSNATLDTAK